MVISSYYIDGYWWFFKLMTIGVYFINGYWCLFY